MIYPLMILAALVTPALADDGGGGWGAVSDALASLLVIVIGSVGVLILSLRSVLVDAIRARIAVWMEEATGQRITRIDDALSTSLLAGRTPAEAAAEVAAKLPRTLERSDKTVLDLEMEASVLKAARPGGEA